MQNGTAVLNPTETMPEYDTQPVRVIASKPTPGPYRVKQEYGLSEPRVYNAGQSGEFRYYGLEIYAGDICIGNVQAYQHTDPAQDTDRSHPFGEVVANGNLLAASWHLLQAAEMALEVFGKCPFLTEEFAAVELLKASIAKAHGQVQDDNKTP